MWPRRRSPACDSARIPGDFEQIAILDPGLEAEARHVVAQGLPFPGIPVLDDVPRRIEAGVVVEQSGPERRQRRQPPPGNASAPRISR